MLRGSVSFRVNGDSLDVEFLRGAADADLRCVTSVIDVGEEGVHRCGIAKTHGNLASVRNEQGVKLLHCPNSVVPVSCMLALTSPFHDDVSRQGCTDDAVAGVSYLIPAQQRPPLNTAPWPSKLPNTRC